MQKNDFFNHVVSKRETFLSSKKGRLLSERDLTSLRVFCAVAQAGGFSAASQRLNMSKASISRHVRAVEDRLKTRLCERGPAGFKLTSAGAAALESSLNALRALDRVESEVNAARGVLSGPLTIGTIEHVLLNPLFRLPESLAELEKKAPNVHPEILVMTHAQLSQALRERTIQIGIRGWYGKGRAFNYHDLFVETQKFYIAATVDREKEKTLPLVYREHPFIDEALNKGLFKRGPSAEGLEAVAVLVATGNYIGLLPEHYAEDISIKYSLRELENSPVFHNKICAITEALRSLPASAELFLEIITTQ